MSMPLGYFLKYELPVRVIHKFRVRLPKDSELYDRLRVFEFAVSFGMSWKRAIKTCFFDWIKE